MVVGAKKITQLPLPMSSPDIPAEAIVMAVVNRISEQEYRELALNEEDRLWELWDGVPVEKPDMSVAHDGVSTYLGAMLINQLDLRDYFVNVNGGKARRSERYYFIPDVVVIPTSSVLPLWDDPRAFNAYAEPLPLVVEVWSRTTAAYDYAVKLQGYRERGDEEIWYIHPYERTLTAWRKQPDGSYTEELYHGGVVPVASLPGVTIDLDALLSPLTHDPSTR
jgi:Uma2 family endonuclease